MDKLRFRGRSDLSGKGGTVLTFLMRGRGPPDEEVEASLQTWKPVLVGQDSEPGGQGEEERAGISGPQALPSSSPLSVLAGGKGTMHAPQPWGPHAEICGS